MKTKIAVSALSLIVALFLASCTKPAPTESGGGTPKKSTIFGWVERSDDLSKVPNVIVYDPSGLAAPDTSNSDGSFRLTYQLTDNYTGTLIATRNTFTADTVTFTLKPGANDTLTRYLVLIADSTSQPTAAGTGVAASIVYISTSDINIAPRGTGADESAPLLFEVRDSLGIPVLTKTRVYFSILGGPGGGEYVFPTSSLTNLSGQVTTRITSGSKSGVVQVYAYARPDTANPGFIVSCSPVRVTISGGLADSSHVTMWTDKTNYPMLVSPGQQVGTISIQLGDQFSNPPQPTAVYFTTNGGQITPTSTTSTTGVASASLFGGAPYPSRGIDTITAFTRGNQSIKRSIIVTASGAPKIVGTNLVAGSIFPLQASGVVQTLTFDVKDNNGNPLSAGNTISASLIGDQAITSQISLSLNDGGTSITTADTRDTSTVHNRLTLTSSLTGAGGPGTFVVLLSSTGPNGNFQTQIGGSLLPKGVTTVPSPTAKLPAQILPGTPSTSDLFVQGVGGTESAQLTFQVLDSSRAPLDKYNRTYANFSINFYPNSLVGGGSPPKVLPSADSTDDQGFLRMSVVSGTEAGVVQVVAKIQLAGGQSIISQPVRILVHAGFADRGHFGITPSRYTFAGYNSSAIPFTVAVGDTFSNPVPAGTEVYFHSQAGRVTTLGATDANGFVTNTLYADFPTPDASGSALAGRPTFDATFGPGYHWVYAQTKGNFGAQIVDSTLVLWCIGPITVTGLPASIAIPSGGTSAPISITVTDGNGNPLPSGTSITISFKYPSILTGLAYSATGTGAGGLSSDQATTIANQPFARFPGAGVTSFNFKVTDASQPATPAGVSIGIVVTINAPGIDTKPFTCTGVF